MKQKLLNIAFLLLLTPILYAQTVWNGPTITFTKAAGANPSLPANQDRITASTWLTRGSVQGLYNIFSETGYTHNVSPANTLWATGTLANYASLTYTDWEAWTGDAPNVSSIVGRQAVLHIVSQNIYIGIKFTAWGMGSGAGGSFSYERTTAPVPAPVKLAGFTAAKKNNAVQLAWTTASEENTASFSIERSPNGREFSSIGSLPAAGFSSSKKAYAFTDAVPLANNFYRLRINDQDSRISYSNVLAFKTAKRMALEIFPVPVKNTLYVQSNNPSQTTLQLADATGKVLKSAGLAAGDHSFTLDVSDLKSGVYFIRTGTESRMLIKE